MSVQPAAPTSARSDADGWLTVQGVQLAVLRRGTGRPLLLLHGEDGLDPRARFLDLLTPHAEIIAPSHPGYGESPLPDTIDSVDDLAYLYLDLLDALDLRDVTLLGFSLGGWIAAELAVRCSARLARLVLVAPVGIKVGDRETRDFPDIFALHPDEVVRLKYHEPVRGQVDYSALSDAELAVIARNREATALYTWEPYLHNPKLRQRLHRVSVPTLLLWGASDRLVTPDDYGRAYQDAIPGARLEIIEQAGHLPEIEQPERFVEHVVRFLDA